MRPTKCSICFRQTFFFISCTRKAMSGPSDKTIRDFKWPSGLSVTLLQRSDGAR